MQIVVDETLCTAHGVCEEVAPDVFEVDDDGIARVLRGEVDGELETVARSAAAQCPARAIILREAPSSS